MARRQHTRHRPSCYRNNLCGAIRFAMRSLFVIVAVVCVAGTLAGKWTHLRRGMKSESWCWWPNFCRVVRILAAEASYTCLDTSAAMECADAFSQCDSIGADKCKCFAELRLCFSKAGCGQAVLQDMATQCTTAGCDENTCTGQANVEEETSTGGCLDTPAAVECADAFSQCDSIGADKCKCFAELRLCFSKADCGQAVLQDMATQCTTAGCDASTCTGQTMFLRGFRRM